MTESFTIGDSIKYSATHHGKKLIINDWETFDKDWGILKEKAKNWGLLFGDMDDPFYDIMKRLECLHEIERRWMEASIMMGRKVLEHQTIAESEIAYQREHKEKLEAVKKYLNTIIIPSVSDITNLKEILEAET